MEILLEEKTFDKEQEFEFGLIAETGKDIDDFTKQARTIWHSVRVIEHKLNNYSLFMKDGLFSLARHDVNIHSLN